MVLRVVGEGLAAGGERVAVGLTMIATRDKNSERNRSDDQGTPLVAPK